MLSDTNFDLVIALDAGELSRYGDLYTRYQTFFDSALILNLDHHVTSQGCGAVSVIDPVSAATAELLTLLLLNRKIPIDLDAARCLLAGIITDTRAFEYDATTERTLAAGAYLVSCGAQPDEIIKPMYRMKPLAQARLRGLVLTTLQTRGAGARRLGDADAGASQSGERDARPGRRPAILPDRHRGCRHRGALQGAAHWDDQSEPADNRALQRGGDLRALRWRWACARGGLYARDGRGGGDRGR